MDFLKTFGPAILLTVAGFLVAYQFVDPAPPDKLVFAAGPEDGAYYRFALRYRAILARENISVEVKATAGSVENIRLLSSTPAEVDLGFVQGGIEADTGTEARLLSLGSVYVEPLWLFRRRGVEIAHITDLQGRRVAVGAPGSGTRAVAVRLLTANDVAAQLTEDGGQEASAALRAGRIDAAFFIASPQAPAVRDLLLSEEVELTSFSRAAAYARRYPSFLRVVLPQGVVDLALNLPPEDIELLAVTANLVAGEELHPALIDLMLQAAREVHGDGGLFEDHGQFPSPRYTHFPLHPDASRFFDSGPPVLQRFLPFWAATLVDRLKVMAVPLLALLLPLIKFMPPLYRWRMRSRIYRWYRRILDVDGDTTHDLDEAEVKRRLHQLAAIENDVAKLTVPLSFADELYHLRMHIELVRKKLLEARDRKPAE